jgi:beta-lactamase superfamily II metal-dependent hydrolase
MVRLCIFPPASGLRINHKLFVASHDEEHIGNVRQMLKAAPKPGWAGKPNACDGKKPLGFAAQPNAMDSTLPTTAS